MWFLRGICVNINDEFFVVEFGDDGIVKKIKYINWKKMYIRRCVEVLFLILYCCIKYVKKIVGDNE